METGFVYRWYDASNGKIYVGSHKGSVDDRYLGSGVLFKRAYNLRPESFFREILYQGEHYKEYEQIMLDYEDAANCEKFYNLINHAWGGSPKGVKKKESTKKKMSEAALGVPKSKKHIESLKAVLRQAVGPKGRRNVPIYSEVLDKEFYSQRHACKELNVSHNYIWHCLTGRNSNEKYRFKKVKK